MPNGDQQMVFHLMDRLKKQNILRKKDFFKKFIWKYLKIKKIKHETKALIKDA